jgi:predicted NAD-dependent protein-ADP-ribosyltransferase YbiA (DUF1768 family)
MVKSKIAKDLNYTETDALSDLDKGHEATMYVLPIFNEKYTIALGKSHTENVEKHKVVYFPFYLIHNPDKTDGLGPRIGVFEIDSVSALTVYDKDGDVRLNKLVGPLLFSYVDQEYLEKGHRGENLSLQSLSTPVDDDADAKEDEQDTNDIMDNTVEDNAEMSIVYDMEKKAKIDDGQDHDQDDDDEDKELYSTEMDDDVNLDSVKKSTTIAASVANSNTDVLPETLYTKETVFTKENPLPTVEPLSTEDQEAAETICKGYKKKKSTAWINNTMKNPFYKIIPIEGNGSCYFSTVCKAFESIGFKTTPEILRKFLSQHITQDHYQQYKSTYDAITNVQGGLDANQDELKDKSKRLQKENEKANTVELQQEIIGEAKKVRNEYNSNRIQAEQNSDSLDEYAFLANIHNVEDLRNYICTPNYWIDDVTMCIMEEILNFRSIIVQNKGRKDMVVCQPVINLIKPDHYIIMEYEDGNHYNLVSYRDRTLFSFDELPYSLKKTVVDVCIPKVESHRVTSDSIYKLDDFRNFYFALYKKTQEEQIQQLQSIENDKPPSEHSADLYDESVVISFHSKADKSNPVGKAQHDKIEKSRMSEFAELNQQKNKKYLHPLWRQRLDDSWVECSDKQTPKDCNGDTLAAPFEIEKTGKKWASISHYLLALQYENTDLYEKLSLDSGSVLSKSYEAVKKAMKTDKTFKVEKKTVENYEAFRKEALMAKFSQHPDLKTILAKTKMAKLVRINGTGNKQILEPDISLMEVRKELLNL